MLNLLLLNLPVMFFSYALVVRFMRFDAEGGAPEHAAGIRHECRGIISSCDDILAMAVLYFFFIVVSLTALGMAGMLSLGWLLCMSALASAVFLALGLGRTSGTRWRTYHDALLGIVPSRRVLFFAASVLASITLVHSWTNLVNPPFGWDSLNYHFTFAVEWMKNHNLTTPIVVSDNPCPSYYPLNGSLLYLWFIMPLSNVFIADMAQLPFFLMLFLTVYSLCLKVGMSREYAFLAGCLTAATPNFNKQLVLGYVDIMVAVWFLAAVNFLLNLVRKVSLRDTVLFCISVGMLIGTKTIGLTYGAFLCFLFAVVLVGRPSRRLFAIVASGIAALVCSGGFWYIRNLVETGNPLFPLSVRFFGREVFPGVMDKHNFTVFSVTRDYGIEKLLFHEGMGAGVLLILIPGTVLFAVRAIRRKSLRIEEGVLLTSFLFVYGAYRYLFSLPNTRYLYPMVAIGYVIAFYVLSEMPRWGKTVRAVAVACVFVSACESLRHMQIAAALLLSLVIFFYARRIYGFLRRYPRPVSVTSAVLLFLLLCFLNNDYNRNEFHRYVATKRHSGYWPDAVQAWEWMNRGTSGNAIAYIGRPVPFPLYGTLLKNNVYYVSVNATEPARLHAYRGSWYHWEKDFLSLHESLASPGNYRSGANYEVWLGNLRRRATDYLFVYSLHQTKVVAFPIEDAWAKENPAVFTPVFTNQTVHVYRIGKR